MPASLASTAHGATVCLPLNSNNIVLYTEFCFMCKKQREVCVRWKPSWIVVTTHVSIWVSKVEQARTQLAAPFASSSA
jgi:hypothetical protein